VRAAWLLGLIGAGSLGGRLVLGSSADRIGRRLSLILALVVMTLSMAWWLASDREWSLALFAVVFGVSYGTFAALTPALTADYFGVAHAGAVIGVLYTAFGPGSLIGPPLAGWAYELRDSYTVPIVAGIVALVIATAFALALPAPRQTTPHIHRM
jgi:MFS family permease